MQAYVSVRFICCRMPQVITSNLGVKIDDDSSQWSAYVSSLWDNKQTVILPCFSFSIIETVFNHVPMLLASVSFLLRLSWRVVWIIFFNRRFQKSVSKLIYTKLLYAAIWRFVIQKMNSLCITNVTFMVPFP